MSKFAAWFLAIALFSATGLAVYEYAFIQHLEFIIKLLAGGQVN